MQACVSRDQRQVFAIGYIIPFATYASIHYASGQNQLDPYQGNALITTGSFRPLHEIVSTREWSDPVTGKVVPGFDLDTTGWAEPPQPGSDLIYVDRSGTQGTMRKRPDRRTFAIVAHCLIASFLGYVGGKFAVFIRKTDHTPPPS